MRVALGAAVLVLALPVAAGAQLTDLLPADAGVEVDRSYDGDILLRATNHGPMQAALTVDLTMPAVLTTPVVPDGCTTTPTGLRCTTPTLLAGSYTVFPITPVPTTRGTHTITALVTSPLTDPRPSNDAAAAGIRLLPSPTVGPDPVASSVAVSAIRFGRRGADHVVLARHDAHPDALAASPLTADGPLLLTPPAALSADVAEEVERVLAPGSTVYLTGGSAALSGEVEAAVWALGMVPVRLAGADRWATSRAVASEVVRLHPASEMVLVAGDGSWADPAAGGAHAAASRLPVVLADPDPALTGAWAGAHGIASTLVVGGTAAVSEHQASQAPAPHRVAGEERSATAAALAALAQPRRGVHLADGYSAGSWPAALLAAGLAADESAPILWVGPDLAPGPTRRAVTSCRLQPVPLAVVGHTISEDVRAALDALDADPRC